MGPRVLICGNGNAAIRCTEALMEQGVEIVCIVPDKKDEGNDGWQRSLVKFAREKNLPIRQEPLKTEESIKWMHEQNLDFIFSFQYYEILRPALLESAKHGVVNLHFAPLPRYRGCFPGAWSLMNGEREMGITLHYIDAGIDTGDIIEQRMFPITLEDNARTLFEKCVENGVILFREQLPSVLKGTNARTKQNDSLATYYGRTSIDFSKNHIDWNQPTETLFHWIRAFTFPPLQYAQTTYEGTAIDVTCVERRMLQPPKEPGTVVQSDAEGMLVATLDGALLLKDCSLIVPVGRQLQ